MNLFSITFACGRHPKRWPTAAARVAAALPALLLVFCPLPLAAQGGKKPGGGGGVTINPPVPLATAPISYERIELKWNGLTNFGDREDETEGYGGIRFMGINQQALAVGEVLRPLGHAEAYRMAVVNFNPGAGVATDEMVQLDDLFQAAMGHINATRTDGPWRIALGRAINAAGLITCRLVPVSEPRSYYSDELPAGKAPVPTLTAVADLNRRSRVDGLVLLDASETGMNQDPLQLTESGHILANYPTGRRIYERVQGAYREVTIPSHLASGGADFSINDNLEILVIESAPFTTTTRLVRYTRQTGSWDPLATGPINPTWVSLILWESSAPSLTAAALGEDSSAYTLARYSVTTGKGKTAQTTYFHTAYHVASPTLRTPLTDADEDVALNALLRHKNLSDALVNGQLLAGEEEFVFAVLKNGVRSFQLYKPNLGTRFILSELWLPENDSVYTLQVSPPLSAGTSSNAAYHGGCIGYGTNLLPRRAFILVPASAASGQ